MKSTNEGIRPAQKTKCSIFFFLLYSYLPSALTPRPRLMKANINVGRGLGCRCCLDNAPFVTVGVSRWLKAIADGFSAVNYERTIEKANIPASSKLCLETTTEIKDSANIARDSWMTASCASIISL